MLKATRIASGMYQGPCPLSTDQVRAHRFTVLAFCAMEIQPMLPAHLQRGLAVLYVPLNDNPNEPMTDAEWELARDAGKEVARLTALGDRSLVTCAAGLNRSGIVNAVALHYRFGCSGAEAVAQIRATRGAAALGNPSFVQRLAKLPRRR
jgi:protein-tyrosine phosphatase